MMKGGRTPRGQANQTGALTARDGGKQAGKPVKTRPGGGFVPGDTPPTLFRRFYDRSDLPVAVGCDVRGPRLKWSTEIEKLDYHHYLPLFFEGMRETREPYATIATQATEQMLQHAPPQRVSAVVPQLILPVKKALETKNKTVVCRTILMLQKLIHSDPLVGETLVPYYRQILPIMNLYKSCNQNTGDRIVYAQSKQNNVGDLIEETLQLLEQSGGEDAYINIKYMVPTYESCVLN